MYYILYLLWVYCSKNAGPRSIKLSLDRYLVQHICLYVCLFGNMGKDWSSSALEKYFKVFDELRNVSENFSLRQPLLHTKINLFQTISFLFTYLIELLNKMLNIKFAGLTTLSQPRKKNKLYNLCKCIFIQQWF